MLSAKCHNCGASYYGWALRFPRHQTCSRCGTGLEIIEDGRRIADGYSPFEAEEHSIGEPGKPAVPRKKSRS